MSSTRQPSGYDTTRIEVMLCVRNEAVPVCPGAVRSMLPDGTTNCLTSVFSHATAAAKRHYDDYGTQNILHISEINFFHKLQYLGKDTKIELKTYLRLHYLH